MQAQLELVWVGCAQHGFFVSDELLGVEIVDGLIESLHAVLADAGGNRVANQARLIRVHDAIAHVCGGDHHFHGRHAALPIGARHQSLADDGLESGSKLQTNLFLLRRREHGDDALNRFRGVQGVQGREHHVAGFGGEQGSADGFQVAHFSDQNQVGVLTQAGAQRHGETCCIHFDFALIDEALFIAVQEFDGVFDSDDVVGAAGIDAVNHGRQRGGLARTGGPGDQHQATLLFANFFDDGRHHQFF